VKTSILTGTVQPPIYTRELGVKAYKGNVHLGKPVRFASTEGGFEKLAIAKKPTGAAVGGERVELDGKMEKRQDLRGPSRGGRTASIETNFDAGERF